MTTTLSGFGPTRKTRKGAQSEVDRWNNSGDGRPWTSRVTGITESIEARVAEVEGGYACEYVTTRTTNEEN